MPNNIDIQGTDVIQEECYHQQSPPPVHLQMDTYTLQLSNEPVSLFVLFVEPMEVESDRREVRLWAGCDPDVFLQQHRHLARILFLVEYSQIVGEDGLDNL